MPTLRTRLEWLIERIDVETATPESLAEDILELLANHLGEDPAGIEEILPDMRLRPRKPERTPNVTTANQVRESRRQERVKEAADTIRKLLADVPTLSNARLALWLNKSQVRPHRKEFWDARAVARVIRESGIERR